MFGVADAVNKIYQVFCGVKGDDLRLTAPAKPAQQIGSTWGMAGRTCRAVGLESAMCEPSEIALLAASDAVGFPLMTEGRFRIAPCFLDDGASWL
jgi:hypothetical protein